MNLVKQLLTFILAGGGSLFVLLAAVGLLRMPDLFTPAKLQPWALS